jgi:hypothetical protein
MRLVKLVAICVAALSIAACGAVRGGAQEPSPTPSEIPLPISPAHGFDVLITDQDRDVTVRVGQKVEVFLRARPGMTGWGGIMADDPSVLNAIPTGIMVVKGASIAGFVAKTAGVTNVTAYASPQCPPNAACPMYAMLYSVRVTVS